MDEKQTSSSSFSRMLGSFVVGALLVFITAVATLYITKTLHPTVICGSSTSEGRLSFPQEDNWTAAEHYDIPGKEVTITRTVDKCYISPLQQRKDDNKASPMQLVHDPLSEEMVEALGGPVALEICEGLTPYMLKNYIPEFEHLKDRSESIRKRRQTNPGGLQVVPETFQEDRQQNRCRDFILICDSAVGQTNTCYTGTNGMFQVSTECKQPTQMQFTMAKPSGRILKVIQKQVQLCKQLQRTDPLKRC